MQLGTIKTIPFVRKHCHIFKRFVLNLNHHCFNRDISILIRYSSAQTKIVYYIRQIKMDDCFFFGKNYLWQLVFSDSPFFLPFFSRMPEIVCQTSIVIRRTTGSHNKWYWFLSCTTGSFLRIYFKVRSIMILRWLWLSIDLINSYSVFFNLETIVSLFPSM